MTFIQTVRALTLGLCVAIVASCGGGDDPFHKEPDVPVGPFGTNTPVARAPITDWAVPVRAAPKGPKVLVLYDAPKGDPDAKMGLGYAIMLQNLLGHFDAAVTLSPVQTYQAHDVDGYDTTFYIGWSADADMPQAFMNDVATTSKRVVWLRSNFDQLLEHKPELKTRLGLQFIHEFGWIDPATVAAGTLPAFFSEVTYKGVVFKKTARYVADTLDVDSEMVQVRVTDATKTTTDATTRNPQTNETAPYVVHSNGGTFWFVADIPFNNAGPRDRYLVFADLLHDMLDVHHAERRQAMVRLEDIDAKVNPLAIKPLIDYMRSQQVPFSLAVIPHYKDPFGAQNKGVATETPLAQATTLRLALDYALANGGEILQHGYTHQSDNMINNVSGASGLDFEFWDMTRNAPMPADSVAWAKGRIEAGLNELLNLGFRPVAWETPHYIGSPNTLRAVSEVFQTSYERASYYTSDHPDLSPAGGDFELYQFFPYVLERDRYGRRVLPETMGNVQYLQFGADEDLTAKELLENARYLSVVRDGFASFFFHPFLVTDTNGRGMADFKAIVEGLSAMGYEWTSPSRLAAGTPAR